MVSTSAQAELESLKLTHGHFIDQADVKLLSRIGHGGYGIIYRGLWKDKEVALKVFQSYNSKFSLRTEIEQLSKVRHDNIVHFHGVCVGPTGPTALVTEYAEWGSLFFLLHNWKTVKYQQSDAIHWALQCAKGVAYLHAIRPKPVVHRDLKTPNLLLFDRGSRLKICDFGTACNVQTIMTNNKGSAAWMAPEVFEGCTYNEKCDVYSWSIVFWEVLARRIPFEEFASSAYQIMWAVHNRQRPADLTQCPEELSSLMKLCWDSSPTLRLSMDQVVTRLEDYLKSIGALDPPAINFASGKPEIQEPLIANSLSALLSKGVVVATEEKTCNDTVQLISAPRTIQLFQNLDRSLQPILPIYDYPQSVKIYEEHVALCERLIDLKRQLASIEKERQMLCDLSTDVAQNVTYESINSHIWHIFEEKKSLVAMRNNFIKEIEQLQNSSG